MFPGNVFRMARSHLCPNRAVIDVYVLIYSQFMSRYPVKWSKDEEGIVPLLLPGSSS